MPGRPQIFPGISGHGLLEMGHAGADSKGKPARFQKPVKLRQSGIQVLDMFQHMQGNDQIKTFIFETSGAKISEMGVESAALGIFDAGIRVIITGGFEPGILLHGTEKIPLTAADFQSADFLVPGEFGGNPSGETLVF